MTIIPTFLFDTGPLITLTLPQIDGKAVIDHLLSFVQITVVETVAQEATTNLAHPDGVRIKSLLDAKRITRLPVPATPIDHLINAYPKLGTGKGMGERDTIRLGTTLAGARVVIDDQQAFFVAARFDLNPTTSLDLFVELTRSHAMKKSEALRVVNAIGQMGRYVPVAIQHTVYKLNEVVDDPHHN